MQARAAVALLFATIVLPCPAQESADFLPNAPAAFRPVTTGAVATRAAVLVAADTYRGMPADGLPTALTTAERLRAALAAHAGFAPGAVSILSGDKVHEREVRAAILAAGRKVQASEDGVLLLTWAGHGWVQGTEATEQYLLTHFSAEQGDAFNDGLSVTQLVSWLSEARAEAAQRGVGLTPVLLVDACRVARGAPPRKVAAIPRAAWQMYGTRQGQMVAAGQGSDPFLFTGALLAKLSAFAGRGGTAALTVVFAACREATLEQSNRVQDPELLAPTDAVLASAGAPALVVPRRVSLLVRCVDALAGTPIANATLRINDEEVKANDGSGQRMVAPGRVVVTSRAEGYLGRTDEVDLARVDAGGEVTLKLVPYVAVVRGRLTPPAMATIVAAGPATARQDFHRVEQTTARDGAFELRVPALAGTRLRVVQQGRELQSFVLPAEPGGFLRDRDGRHDGVPLVEILCELSEPTLRELGADAPPVPSAGEPQLTDLIDRTDWEQAQEAVAKKRWDIALTRLRGIKGDPERVGVLRRQVEARWAIGRLEHVLTDGKTNGEWGAVGELRKWWEAKPEVDEAERIAGLFAEIEREGVPLAVRRGFEAGNKAYADGELERALSEYEKALKGANQHYGTKIEEQRADIGRRLYRRHASVAFQAELLGDLTKALDAYGKALEHSGRAKGDIERLLADPKLARTARGRELARKVGVPVAAGPDIPEPVVPKPADPKPAVPNPVDPEPVVPKPVHREPEVVKPPVTVVPNAIPSDASGKSGTLPADFDCAVLDATPGAKSGYPKKVKDNKSGIVFLLVEPGEFQMGSTTGYGDEKPVHTVRITKPFYLAETETTQAQWEAVMGRNPSYSKGARRPVENVSWDDAWECLRKLNGGGDAPFRLPTEAEWEYACRAGTTTAFACGDVVSTDEANYDGGRSGTNRKQTIDAGSLGKPNAWGFHDMHGNVHELCQDWYDAGYYATCRDGVDDPQGAARGSSRVVRGGAWNNIPDRVRSASRNRSSLRSSFVGFRVARTLQP